MPSLDTDGIDRFRIPYFGPLLGVDTLRPEQNGWYIADDILRFIFYKEVFVFWLKWHWKLLLMI